MKIIHKGELLTPIFKGRCTACDSLMEEEKDKLCIQYDPKLHDTCFAKAECPVCKREFVLYPKRKDS